MADPQAQALALGELIKMTENGRLTERETWLQTYLALSQQLENSEGVGIAIHALAVHAQMTGQYAKAVQYLQQCETICHLYEIQQGLGYVWLSLAHVYLDTGDFDQARSYLEKSVAMGREVALSQNLIPLGLIALIEVETAVNDYAAAQAHFQECRRLLSTIDFQMGDSLALQSMGRAAYAQGDWRQAQLYLLQALQLLEPTNAPLHTAEALVSLGYAVWQMGDRETAVAHWQRAAALAQEHGSTPLMLAALAAYSQQLAAQGDEETAKSLRAWIDDHPKTRWRDRHLMQQLMTAVISG